MSAPLLPRRRAAAALAAAGLPVAALAAPPLLPPPDAPPAGPVLPAPGEAAPNALESAFEAAKPLPAPRRDWTSIPGFRESARRPADRPEPAGADADDRPAAARGWLSFRPARPARVRPASNLAPVPDPQYGAPAPHDLDPVPSAPPARFEDYPADNYAAPALPDRSFPAPDAGFSAVPRSSYYNPAATPQSDALPPGAYAGSPLPLRDLRTPPPPFAPPGPYAVDPYAADPFAAGLPPVAGYGGGLGAGFGAGPVADLAVAGGMCDAAGCGVELFHAVRVEDRRNISPRSVHKVIAVADPRLPAPPHGLAKLFRRVRLGRDLGRPECDPCDLGDDALVFVDVCVPDCRPEEVKVTRSGRRVHLDYGKYEVTLTARDGYVHVDYDD